MVTNVISFTLDIRLSVTLRAHQWLPPLPNLNGHVRDQDRERRRLLLRLLLLKPIPRKLPPILLQ